MDPETSTVSDVLDWDRANVLHPWMVNAARRPLVVTGADGCEFWDDTGQRYLDFTSQFANANPGHRHPRIVDAIAEQARTLPFAATPFATEAASRAGHLLAEVIPGNLQRTFFSTGGAGAIEAAIKIARLATGRRKIIGRIRDYHGATYGAMTVGRDSRTWPNEPGIPSVSHVPEAYPLRCPFGCGSRGGCDLVCADAVEHAIRSEGGGDKVAAVMIEPIPGAGGVIVPPDGYLQRVREICDRHGVLLIADEVMTGFGRTGEWFACDHWDVVPDIMALAKGINGGYVPLGATVVTDEVGDRLDDRFLAHGLTYSGHALACAAAVATIETYRDEAMVENARRRGAELADGVAGLVGRHPSVAEGRGRGLFWGLELVRDPESGQPVHDALAPPAGPTAKQAVLAAAMERGVYCMPGGASVIMLAPPLPVTSEQLQHGVAVLDEALDEADRRLDAGG
jgi:taurine--2-oxoglutarate transaminase